VTSGVDPSRRVRVTGPRSTAVTKRRTAASEIDAQTQLGEIYMTSLLRAQLRLAVLVLVTLLGTLVALPLVFRLFPGLVGVHVLGMPLSWVLLAFAAYPWLLLLGWIYVRAAERNERDFTDVVGRR
jgi:uncharacterized membrane protein (DUF485 family)